MVGANMAFSRSVLEQVPAFDVELGPGALGFGDDTLFSQQLKIPGYRIAAAPDAVVEHHFLADRLQPDQWIQSARKLGKVDAYISHHWEHSVWPHPYRMLCVAWLRLVSQRLRFQFRRDKAVVSESLLVAVRCFYAPQYYLRIRNIPRNYDQYGLVKLVPRATAVAAVPQVGGMIAADCRAEPRRES